jgi:cytochrome c551/c552
LTLAELMVNFGAKFDTVEQSLRKMEEQNNRTKKAAKDAEDQGKKTHTVFENLGKAINLGIFVMIAKKVWDMGKEFLGMGATADAEMKKVEASVRAAGFSMESTMPKIDAYSKKMIQLGFDDEDTAMSVSHLLGVTKDWDQAITANQAAMDLARKKHIDLETATSAVSRAYSGQTRVLKEFGIEVRDGATGMEVLNAVMGATKGQAEAFANSIEGRLQVVKIQLQNIGEDAGMKLFPAVSKVLTAFSNIAPTLSDLLVALAGTFGDTLTSLMPLLEAIGTGLVKVLTDAAPMIEVVVAALGQFGEVLAPYIPQIADFIGNILIMLTPILGDILNAVIRVTDALMPLVASFMDMSLQLGQNLIPVLGDLIRITLAVVVPALEITINTVKALGNYLFSTGEILVGVLTGNMDLIKKGIKGFSDTWTQSGVDYQKTIDSITGKTIVSAKQVTTTHAAVTKTVVEGNKKQGESYDDLAEKQRKFSQETKKNLAEAAADQAKNLKEIEKNQLEVLDRERDLKFQEALDNNASSEDFLNIIKTYELKRQKVIDDTNKAIGDANKEFHTNMLNEEISSLEASLSADKLSGNKQIQIQKDIHAKKLALLDEEKDKEIQDAEEKGLSTTNILKKYDLKKIALEKDTAQKIKSINQQSFDWFISTTQDIVGKLQNLNSMHYNNKSLELDNYYATEKARIEASAIPEEEKAKLIEALDKDTERKRKELARQKAQDDKKFATFQAIVDTASAITKALASTFPPLNFILAGIAGAMGAAQISLIKSQPLPALAKGGEITQEGDVIVGEEGIEKVRLPRGAQVIPLNHPAGGIGGSGRDPFILILEMDRKQMARILVKPITDEIRIKGNLRG